MDYRERIEAKVGILFQIADQYLSGQMPLEEAKELFGCEMVSIRPAQFEAVKTELGERLTAEDNPAKSEKLFELFRNYLPPPYHKLQAGHPLRNYYEENSMIRSVLLKIDEMEGEEAARSDWRERYELLSEFTVHINRLEKNFYPLLIPIDMRLQVEKAKDLGKAICNEISENLERLESGAHFDFLLHQRSLSQILMNYLDLEERVLYSKALISLKDQNFVNLRRSDDKEGYAFIEQPADFAPKEKRDAGNGRSDPGPILSALLEAKDLGIIYYTLAGEVVSVMGNQITEADLNLSEDTRKDLLERSGKRIIDCYNQGNHTFQITYSLVRDSMGIEQGILKTKENIGGIKELAEEHFEGIDSTQNIAELFRMYPKFREDFFSLNEELKGLKGPFGMELLKDSTVGMLAKSLRIDADDLVEKINKLLAGLA